MANFENVKKALGGQGKMLLMLPNLGDAVQIG
jgi:hypothetical protein